MQAHCSLLTESFSPPTTLSMGRQGLRPRSRMREAAALTEERRHHRLLEAANAKLVSRQGLQCQAAMGKSFHMLRRECLQPADAEGDGGTPDAAKGRGLRRRGGECRRITEGSAGEVLRASVAAAAAWEGEWRRDCTTAIGDGVCTSRGQGYGVARQWADMGSVCFHSSQPRLGYALCFSILEVQISLCSGLPQK